MTRQASRKVATDGHNGFDECGAVQSVGHVLRHRVCILVQAFTCMLIQSRVRLVRDYCACALAHFTVPRTLEHAALRKVTAFCALTGCPRELLFRGAFQGRGLIGLNLVVHRQSTKYSCHWVNRCSFLVSCLQCLLDVRSQNGFCFQSTFFTHLSLFFCHVLVRSPASLPFFIFTRI